jgi:hypothetical protein
VCRSRADTRLVLALVIAALVCPRQAAAQRAPVVRGLADLRLALDGTYGDEGADIARRLTELSDAVANWDRSIRETEQNVRSRLEGANPADAARAHETLGSLYLERGRLADAISEFEAASPSSRRCRSSARSRSRPTATLTSLPPRFARGGGSTLTTRSRPTWR